jgi:2-polyprenyl-6-hydroxyphenyl methylase/3-demethylubiquinone-9 3-methyltransferase
VATCHQYGWKDGEATCAHAYLLPIILGEIRALGADRPLRILDLGCGNGYVSAELARLGHDVLGVDVSPDGIEIARRAYPAARFEVCSVYDERLATLAGGPLDCVIALEVIEHLYYPRSLLSQAHALLRPGGRVIVSTPYHGYVKNLAISLCNGWDAHFHAGWDGGHIKFFSRRSLSALIREAGFGEPRFIGAGRAPLLWKSMLLVAGKQ